MDLLKPVSSCLLGISILFSPTSFVMGDDVDTSWPQFRGANGQAITESLLPETLDVDNNLAWKTELPSGHSSPCVFGNRIFLTGFTRDTKTLETICIDRISGKILWRRTAPTTGIEKVHKLSNPANATPAADAERVYVYFGSYGLLCYDHAGAEQWKRPLAVPKTTQGTGSSPILSGDILLLHRDQRNDPCLLAINTRDGETVWKHQYVFSPSIQPESYSTPAVWKDEIVVHAHNEFLGIAIKTGEKLWSVTTPTNGCSSPAIYGDIAYITGWSNGGEEAQRTPLPKFGDLIKTSDKNGDGKISRDELPAELAFNIRPEAGDAYGAQVRIKRFFSGLDRNKDDKIGAFEWGIIAAMQTKLYSGDHGLQAIRLGGRGDVTDTHVLWAERTAVPEVPSPVFHDGRVYMVKNGGIVTCSDAKTGDRIYRRRLGASGVYFASIIGAKNCLYATSGKGVIVVFSPGDKLRVLSRNDLGEPIAATPAVADGSVYIRSESHLFAFTP